MLAEVSSLKGIQSQLSELSDTLTNTTKGPSAVLGKRSLFAVLIKHGGFQILLNPGSTIKRLQKNTSELTDDDALVKALALQAATEKLFQKICEKSYAIPACLMSYLAIPHEGKTFTPASEPETVNYNLPAVFTFIGQFIDHDLTFNGLDLFDDETLKTAPNFATPKLDLDSVYGRMYSGDPEDTGIKQDVGFEDIFDDFGRFKLNEVQPGKFDVFRFTDNDYPLQVGAAYIFDPRNDENQLILQVHILIERLHNQLLADGKYPKPMTKDELKALVMKIRVQVVEIWQSVVMNDYLKRVCQASVLTDLRDSFKKKDYSKLHYLYNSGEEVPLKMPHEFAIAFRFGHSMLRTAYKINNGPDIALFNNRNFLNQGTLAGSKHLEAGDHFVDWNVFFPDESEKQPPPSLRIDSKVTPVVFDLPESTIPDHIKSIGNLPHRNLIRSREINLASGEDVAACFGLTGANILSPTEVEPNPAAHPLFQQDQNVYDNTGNVVDARPFKGHLDSSTFKTPLWYYVLREAEVREGGQRLGALGSHIVAEVILGGIYYPDDFVYQDDPSKVLFGKVTQQNVKFRDIIDYVLGTLSK